jgi:hypothetical protein
MSFPVGIGIVTYNRKEILSDTIDRVRALTRQPGAALVVADDGSNDGTEERVMTKKKMRFYPIKGDMAEVSGKSFSNGRDEERNLQLARVIMGERGYRAPRGKDNAMRQFRSETENAMIGGPGRFRLPARESHRRQPAGRGIFSLLFHRR